MTLDELKVVITAETKGFNAAISDIKSQLSNLSKSIDQTLAETDKFSKREANALKNNYIEALQDMCDEAEKELGKLSDILLETTKVFGWDSKEAEGIGNLSDEFDAYYRSIKKIKEEFSNLFVDSAPQQGLNQLQTELDKVGDIDPYERLGQSLDGYIAKLDALKARIASGETDVRTNSNGNSWDQLKSSANRYQKAIDKLIERFAALNNVSLNNLLEELAKINPEYADAYSKKASSLTQNQQDTVKFNFASLAKGLLGIRGIYELVRKIVSKNENLTNSIDNLINSLSNLFSPLLDIIANLMNFFAGLISAFGKLLGISNQVSKSTAETAKNTASFDEINNLNNNSSASTEAANENKSLKELWDNLSGIEKVLVAISGIVATIFAIKELPKLIDLIKTSLLPVLKKIKDFFASELGKSIAGGVAVIVGAILSITSFLDMWNEGFSWAKEAVMLLGIALVAVGAILLGAGVGITAAIAAIVAVVATLAVVIHDNWDAIVEWTTNAWNKVVEFLAATWETIKTTAIAVFEAVKEFIVTIVEKIKEGIVATFNAVKEFIVNTWTAIKTATVTAWENLKTAVVTSVNNIKNNLVTAFNNIKTSILNIWEGIKKGIKSVINGIIGFINGMLNGVTTGINKIIDLANSIKLKVPTNKVTEFFGIAGWGWDGLNIPKISSPQIPLLANGGIASGPTLAMVGEYAGAKSNPEVIAPLSKLEGMLNSGDIVARLDKLISVTESKDFKAYISSKEIGKAAVSYINNQSRIMGSSLV